MKNRYLRLLFYLIILSNIYTEKIKAALSNLTNLPDHNLKVNYKNDAHVDTIFDSKYKSTLLHEAAKSGDIQRLIHLLEPGTENVDSEDKNSETSLHLAIKAKQIDAIKVLIFFRANLNALDIDCKTPLELAKLSKDHDITNALLKAGAH